MNTQIIAIANQKGGVGKTTTCANLGIGLAQAGKKVLLIDGDPQGSLTISLGNPQPDKLPFTLSDAMGKILMDQPIRTGEGILHHAEGVDLMPADIQLSGMEVSLVNAMSRETILRQYLDTLKGQYSHILIDCQPSLGMLTVNALAAANRIIIPVQAEYLPAKGLEQLLSTVNKVKRQINPKLQIDGILYGRMIEIYCTVSIAPIPIATMSNREWGSIGTNYLKGLFALAFQGFLIMVCVGIYAVLINGMIIADNIHSALFSVAAYTVILCFSLFKTGSLAKSIFHAH